MTPEELDRKIEFLVEWEARSAVQHELDRKEFARIFKTLSDLIEIESGRLDRNDIAHRKFQETMQQLHEESQQLREESHRLQDELLRLLHRILDRLPEQPNTNPN